MIIKRDTKCKPSRKDCDIRPSKMPSLAAMGTIICHNHIEVVSYNQPEGDE